jgi:hypothetical protein
MAETLEVPAAPLDDAAPATTRRPSTRAVVVVVALAALGLGVRLWIMTGRLGAIDSDEAITGLMARHLLDGELRAFMWRLSYQGTIVTWPVAASFWLFGSSRFTLELPFLLMSAGATVMVWRIGQRILSPFQAAFGALAFWLWPAIYVWISVKPLIFYVPTLVLGLGVLLCAVRVAEKPGRVADWCVLGLCAGAGWWTSPNIMYFAVPVGVWLLVFHRRALWPGVLYAAPCAVLGALPWIWNQATYGLTAFELKEGQAQGSYVDHLGYFFTHALPTALGMRAPLTGDWVLGGAGPVLYVGVLAALAAAVVLLCRDRSVAAVGLLSLPFVFAFNPVASNLATGAVGNGRYFYFFTPFLAFAVARLVRPVAPAVVVALVLAASTVWGFARLYEHREAIGVVPDLDRVIARLEREGHHEVFASFWVSSRLTFESDERIIAVATDLGPTFKGFEDRVRNAPNPVYVTNRREGGPFDPLAALRDRAQAEGIALDEIPVGDYLIVVPERRMVAPPAFDLSTRP